MSSFLTTSSHLKSYSNCFMSTRLSRIGAGHLIKVATKDTRGAPPHLHFLLCSYRPHKYNFATVPGIKSKIPITILPVVMSCIG